jgi:hypothetical protein
MIAALPGRGIQAPEERDGRGAHRRELGHDIAERPLPEVGGRRVVGELDLRPHDGIGARDAERAVAENALDVGHVPDDLEDVPLARRLSPERLSRREGAQVRRALGDLVFERLHDVPVRDEADVLEVVWQALVGVRTSGVMVGVVHPGSPLQLS